MLYKEGMDLDGTARHNDEGKDHPYSHPSPGPPSQVASRKARHMNVVSNTNLKVGLSSYHKNKHIESPSTK